MIHFLVAVALAVLAMFCLFVSVSLHYEAMESTCEEAKGKNEKSAVILLVALAAHLVALLLAAGF